MDNAIPGSTGLSVGRSMSWYLDRRRRISLEACFSWLFSSYSLVKSLSHLILLLLRLMNFKLFVCIFLFSSHSYLTPVFGCHSAKRMSGVMRISYEDLLWGSLESFTLLYPRRVWFMLTHQCKWSLVISLPLFSSITHTWKDLGVRLKNNCGSTAALNEVTTWKSTDFTRDFSSKTFVLFLQEEHKKEYRKRTQTIKGRRRCASS